MGFRLAADALVLAHGAFILFAAFGGLLALRWQWLALLHLPAAIWGALIEAAGWVCPLTSLEVSLRIAAGEAGYRGGFVERYLIPAIYPADLTRDIQLALAAGLAIINLAVYAAFLKRHCGASRRAKPKT